jgi:hypothetical protein
MKRRAAIQTTLGDLVAALTEEVTPFTSNEREKNFIVAHILADLLKRRAATADNHKIIAL